MQTLTSFFVIATTSIVAAADPAGTAAPSPPSEPPQLSRTYFSLGFEQGRHGELYGALEAEAGVRLWKSPWFARAAFVSGSFLDTSPNVSFSELLVGIEAHGCSSPSGWICLLAGVDVGLHDAAGYVTDAGTNVPGGTGMVAVPRLGVRVGPEFLYLRFEIQMGIYSAGPDHGSAGYALGLGAEF